MILLDTGFFSADLLLHIQTEATNRHWLIPERKGLVYTELERYGDSDRLLQMKVSQEKPSAANALASSRSDLCGGRQGENGIYFPPRGAIQRSSGGAPVPRALGNRAGIQGYQKPDAAQCHHAEEQEGGLGVSEAVGAA